MAARQLRYTWLEQVRKGNAYDYIVVAHHQDDAVETFFINLIRGTGLTGLSGIPAKNGCVIRPFLSCSRAQLADFANANGVHYRNDSSNASDYYVRNKLRLNLLPELRKINPALNHTIVEEMSHFSEINAAFGEVVKQTWNALIEVGENNTVILPKAKLERLQHLQVYLFYFLQPYGFNKSTVNDILIGFQKTEEAEYFSVTHRLVRQRTDLVLEPIQLVAPSPTYSIHKRTAEMSAPFPMTVQHSLKKDLTINKAATHAYFDATTLTYPLELRKWKKGDAFYPFGMRGRKKLSDFFTDLKMSGVEKESTWVLTSGGEIMWVVGHRIDRRFALKEVTTNVVVFRLIQRK
jgi:tRNA(Ile)-lysidine synthase